MRFTCASCSRTFYLDVDISTPCPNCGTMLQTGDNNQGGSNSDGPSSDNRHYDWQPGDSDQTEDNEASAPQPAPRHQPDQAEGEFLDLSGDDLAIPENVADKKTPKLGTSQDEIEYQAKRQRKRQVIRRILDKTGAISRLQEEIDQGHSSSVIDNSIQSIVGFVRNAMQGRDTNEHGVIGKDTQMFIFGREYVTEEEQREAIKAKPKPQRDLTQTDTQVAVSLGKATAEMRQEKVIEALAESQAKAKLAVDTPTGVTIAIPQLFAEDDYVELPSQEFKDLLDDKNLVNRLIGDTGCPSREDLRGHIIYGLRHAPRPGCLWSLTKLLAVATVMTATAIAVRYREPKIKEGDFDGDRRTDKAVLYRKFPWINKPIYPDTVALGQKDGSLKDINKVFEDEKKPIIDRYNAKVARLRDNDTRRKAKLDAWKTKALAKLNKTQLARAKKINKAIYPVNSRNTSGYRGQRR